MFNKKRMIVFFVFIICLFFMMTYASGNDETVPIATRTVTFTDGITNSIVSKQKVEIGKNAKEPKNPEHDDYSFDGWYLMDNLTKKVTSFKNIKKNLKVVAKYSKKKKNNEVINEGNNNIALLNLNNNINTIGNNNVINPINTKKILSLNDLSNIDFNDKTVVYDSLNHIVKIDGILPLGVNVIYTNNVFKNAGTYSVTATFTGDGQNYVGSVQKTITYKIEKANVTVTADEKDGEYGDNIKSLTYKSEGIVYNDDDLNIELSTDATIDSNVGEYDININANNSNYNITANTSKYTINPKEITTKKEMERLFGITFNDKELEYDGKDHTVEVSGNDENFDVIYSNNTHKNVNIKKNRVEPYSANAKIVLSGNYTGFVKLYSKFTIKKANVKLTANDKESTYNSELIQLDYNVEGEVFNDDNLNVILSTDATKESNVGIYDIKINASNSNYNITANTGKYIINAKNITTEDELTKLGIAFDKTNFNYDAQEHSVLLKENNDLFTPEYENNTKVDAGNYTATAIVTLKGNYTGKVTLKSDYIINKAPVTITANNVTATYGDDLKELYYNIDGEIYNNDNLNIVPSTNATKESNVGEYDININASNSNYNITANAGKYIINAKNITTEDELKELFEITYEDKTLTYNGIEQEITVNGNDENFEVIYTDNKRIYVGESNAEATIKLSGNYTGEYKLNAKLTINPAVYTVSFKNEGKKYIDDQKVSCGYENQSCEANKPTNNPTKPNTDDSEFKFKGWAIDGTTDIVDNFIINKDTTYIAIYDEISNKYKHNIDLYLHHDNGIFTGFEYLGNITIEFKADSKIDETINRYENNYYYGEFTIANSNEKIKKLLIKESYSYINQEYNNIKWNMLIYDVYTNKLILYGKNAHDKINNNININTYNNGIEQNQNLNINNSNNNLIIDNKNNINSEIKENNEVTEESTNNDEMDTKETNIEENNIDEEVK